MPTYLQLPESENLLPQSLKESKQSFEDMAKTLSSSNPYELLGFLYANPELSQAFAIQAQINEFCNPKPINYLLKGMTITSLALGTVSLMGLGARAAYENYVIPSLRDNIAEMDRMFQDDYGTNFTLCDVGPNTCIGQCGCDHFLCSSAYKSCEDLYSLEQFSHISMYGKFIAPVAFVSAVAFYKLNKHFSDVHLTEQGTIDRRVANLLEEEENLRGPLGSHITRLKEKQTEILNKYNFKPGLTGSSSSKLSINQLDKLGFFKNKPLNSYAEAHKVNITEDGFTINSR